ncbi:hypothetical protein [Acetobacter oeni]|uniref:Uncharacterized protein n=1 Tax=Acetobacter oeni TaxID=304077 RepID=A0A511XHN7_9PROT|nr:hypothetical protein [Acetobacter oeni]MBB3882599.1 hypothetical protein [Acetobacter oeni]NHO18592.1 hypothetical protein [Acetobacter oeni]GBR12087.1 hypothetical protein AA21952_3541 [Acetobacter oeni LMG 21952]GEN62466.1 hypothetical protein AOE01nite_06900 [Acetobacter oeni]
MLFDHYPEWVTKERLAMMTRGAERFEARNARRDRKQVELKKVRPKEIA